VAFPVLPELAVPLALPDWDDPEPCGPEPPWPRAPWPWPLHPSPGFLGAPDVVGALFSEGLGELLPAVAGPVFPSSTDWVSPVVLAFPELAPKVEFDVALIEAGCPPLPESPEVATRLAMTPPVPVELVESVLPEVALLEPLPNEERWPFLQ
jgi:hypothetical protein